MKSWAFATRAAASTCIRTRHRQPNKQHLFEMTACQAVHAGTCTTGCQKSCRSYIRMQLSDRKCLTWIASGSARAGNGLTSATVASGLPYMMLSITLPLNSRGSWLTRPICNQHNIDGLSMCGTGLGDALPAASADKLRRCNTPGSLAWLPSLRGSQFFHLDN